MEVLKRCNTLLIAFSGGVDSTFLLAAALEAVRDRVLAVTSHSGIHPERERDAAINLARDLGVKLVHLDSNKLTSPDFLSNTPRRCYICKKALFEKLSEIARDAGIRNIAHGANVDDLSDFRPGYEAAQEAGILAPLVEAGLTKAEIRRYSKAMGLPTWNKPPMACLATRIPFWTPITHAALERIDKAETLLLRMGFTMCRVRHMAAEARIEVLPDEVGRFFDPEIRRKITASLKKLGFDRITIDLQGYRQGSLNPREIS